jgi:putative FmdB family regulatory protein
MVKYSFKCDDCSDEFTVKLAMDDYDKSQACPSCKSKQTNRVFGDFGFSIKKAGCKPCEASNPIPPCAMGQCGI